MGKSCLVCCLLMILLFFVSLLNIKVGTLPSTYLGLPLGAPFRSVSVWERGFVEDSFYGNDYSSVKWGG